MTVAASTSATAATTGKQPQPPPQPRARPQRGAAPGDKRFTVRDGFHLKTRNDERRLVIDQQLLPQREPASASEATADDAAAAPSDRPLDGSSQPAAAGGPSALEIPMAVHWKLSSKESRHQHNNDDDEGDYAASISAVVTGPTVAAAKRPISSTAPPYTSSRTVLEAKVITTRLEPSSDWLIYRQRANATPRRRDQRVEDMVQRVLRSAPAPENASDHAPVIAVLTPSAKESEQLPPTRPRQASLSGSTYHQRVLAVRQLAGRSDSSPRSHHPLGELAPITETERSLLSSREETNRDVDRLLTTLFQQQQQVAVGGSSSVKPAERVLAKPANLRFSTRRSVLREQTAAALKSRNLVSRMDELRSLPQVLEHMVQRQRAKQQQLVERHGQNLVLKNKQQSCLQLLQRPPLTPVFPSSTEQKQQQASRRKQVFDAREEAAVRGAVDRWQRRRQLRQEEARRTYTQCQWLLLTALAQSAASWLGRFQDWKLRRDALRHVVMARRIQAFWREHAARRRRFGAGYRGIFTSSGSRISSPRARMPLVMKAIALLQRAMRHWLRRKQDALRVAAVEVIVTSWLEFQDVKFRRLILRFRKRVRDFQVMWRAWRAITDARIKLLLLVWAKLEKKSKRRNGVNLKPPGVPESGGSSALVHSLQAALHMSPERRQKHLEGLHRHLKNGGTIHTPLAIATASGAGAAHAALTPSAAAGGKPSPSIAAIAGALSPGFSKSMRVHKISDRVKQNLEVRQQIGEDLQNAMQDFVAATTSDLHAHPSHSPLTMLHSPSRFLGGARGKAAASAAPPHATWKALADAVGTPTRAEKIPLLLKATMLRQLLSEKRKAFQVAKDKKRMEWRSRRQQMRRVEFRYNVLEEMVEYQRFEAENAVFLVLHHVSEAELLHLMHRAQQLANAAAAVVPGEPHRPGSSGLFAGESLAPLTTLGDTSLASNESASQSVSSASQPPLAFGIRAARRSTVGHTSTASRAIANALVVKLLDDEE